VLATLLAPIGYVMQDVVADAMTVEAVPRHGEYGEPYSAEILRGMHTTMQTLGRVAVVGGGILVALLNIFMFSGVENMSVAEQADVYVNIYCVHFHKSFSSNNVFVATHEMLLTSLQLDLDVF